MSTISKTIRLDGSLYDPSSVQLSSPDGAYGVVTLDGATLVVPSGTDLVRASPGVYAKTFTDPAYGLHYRYSLRVVHAGAILYSTYTMAGALNAPGASNSVIERMAQNIITTLQGIATAAGYQNTVADVVRPAPGVGNQLNNMRLVVFQGGAAREQECPEQYTQWLQDFHVMCEVVESEGSATPVDQRLNSLACDVERALCLTRTSQTRGGLAEDTILDARTTIPCDPQAHDGAVLVNIGVRYRTRYNDPLTSVYD